MSGGYLSGGYLSGGICPRIVANTLIFFLPSTVLTFKSVLFLYMCVCRE